MKYNTCRRFVSCHSILKSAANKTEAQVKGIGCQESKTSSVLEVRGKKYVEDGWTNVTPRILSYLGRNIYLQKNHPLSIIRQKIVGYFYGNYQGHRAAPIFSVHEDLNPVVSTSQNFDSLLIGKDHPSRQKSDCYYVNEENLLRAHMTAHQADLIKSGLDRFLMIGDVYRRDQVDASHFPVFHQVDAVRLFSQSELFGENKGLKLFDKGKRTHDCQESHCEEAAKRVEMDLKSCLMGLSQHLFGLGITHRWTETYFPFTHPSWELEIDFKGEWLEVLGCGIIEQNILKEAGAGDRVGWAFGLGLERLAMLLFDIPDIRLFWSKDSGFLSQFKEGEITKYKPISVYPQCANDLSFWLPKDVMFSPNDFYDLVRITGGDIVEQVTLVDDFTHPKTGRKSHCYRIVYRHMERTLTQEEVNVIHSKIAEVAKATLGVVIR
ncbi:probable phenylalanine--tRNA ligase, mitochondrial [Ischnura elegans]|uniref:probable phenylalanine--tRNA ligase, mitochondrial n=1 Tax=Ischnura elegans TaxID=197161 RepID=UPI001ED89177|nr:probable phenylalanine--tRNA ligase, mitochondrial [Ischnura elegans]